MPTSRMSSKRRCWPRRVPCPCPSCCRYSTSSRGRRAKEMRAVLEQLARRLRRPRRDHQGDRQRFPLPGAQRVRARGVAAVAGSPAQVFARAARDPGADRLPPAHHARRDRKRARRGREPGNRQDADGAQLGARRRPSRRARPSRVAGHHGRIPRLLLAQVHRGPAAAGRAQVAQRPQPAAAAAGHAPARAASRCAEGLPDGSGEVALVPVVDESADKLDAAADDDADDEELAAPGSSASGLVAAPPSDES